MSTEASDDRHFGDRSIRLTTLVRLRWLAVGGQLATVLFVALGLGFALPLMPSLALIGLAAALNLWLGYAYGTGRRLGGDRATQVLGFDLAQLGGLLYLTGGLANPFAVLLIAPVIVAATALSLRCVGILGGAAVLIATSLTIWHQPLPWYPGEAVTIPRLYGVGNWLALVITLGFIAAFTFRVAEEGRRLDDALAETELVLAREQHMSQLDGLAAAAAHALGTPLGTIAIVAKELEREMPADSPFAEDVALLRTQSERCRQIMRKLSSLADEPEPHFQRMTLAQLIEEVIAPHRDFGVDIDVDMAGDGPEPVAGRDPAILYGLGNLIENAVDFANSTVAITARWSKDSLELTLTDDGPGFAPGVLSRLGEPYLTARGQRHGREDGTGGGLGLGFFIAQTLLRRSGATLAFANREAPETGAVIRLSWKRSRFDLPPENDLYRQLA